jgi:hypothetical protein
MMLVIVAVKTAVTVQVANQEAVGDGNDLHHLSHAHIHRFTAPVRRNSEYVSGTSLALSGLHYLR